MSLKTVRSPRARSITVTESGDVLLWNDDSFSGDPEMLGDFSVGDVAHRFGYRSVADLPPESITEAWWAQIQERLSMDEFRFVETVVKKQQFLGGMDREMWKIYGLRTSDRLYTVRLAVTVGAFDKDFGAWELIKKTADDQGATVEIVDQFFSPGDPSFPVTVVELWWECVPGYHPARQNQQVIDLWAEFKESKYARPTT